MSNRIVISLACASMFILTWTTSAAPIDNESSRPISDDKSADARASSDSRSAAALRRVVPKKKGEISFDNILFEIPTGEKFSSTMIPDRIKKLNNTQVTIRGYILPASVFQDAGIKSFVLVRDNQECCFGPTAALYDCIMVRMVEDNTARFSTRPVAVSGKFMVTDRHKLPDGQYMAIYELQARKVK